MNETDRYILGVIQTSVWGGFDSPEDVQELISDLLEDEGDEDADEDLLRRQVRLEFRQKLEAEKSWPLRTDNDRLDAVFDALEKRGILCLHNAGHTMSDGHADAAEALAERTSGQFSGYCFYHGQDLERAVSCNGLMLAFDHVKGDVPEKLEIALAIWEELQQAGFRIEWDGTADQRINLPEFDWKRRS